MKESETNNYDQYLADFDSYIECKNRESYIARDIQDATEKSCKPESMEESEYKNNDSFWYKFLFLSYLLKYAIDSHDDDRYQYHRFYYRAWK